MGVKIVAEEDVLLETVATQDTQDRGFLFIQYLYPNETRQETRKRPKIEMGQSVQSKSQGAIEDFFDLGFVTTIKNYSFSWNVYSSLSLVESLTFSWYCV